MHPSATNTRRKLVEKLLRIDNAVEAFAAALAVRVLLATSRVNVCELLAYLLYIVVEVVAAVLVGIIHC